MTDEMKQTADAIRAELVNDGLLPEHAEPLPVETDLRFVLTPEEVVLVRKVLQVVNTLFTVASKEYQENKIDLLLQKMKQYEKEAQE